MRKNEAGLTILERGDVVRIGKGKVLYTVLSDVVTAEAHIESQNTGKAQTVDASRLSLVASVQYAEWAATGNLSGKPETLDNEEMEEPVKETSAYAKAVLFALNKLGKHVYAGTAKPKRRVARLAKQARRNARKAVK